MIIYQQIYPSQSVQLPSLQTGGSTFGFQQSLHSHLYGHSSAEQGYSIIGLHLGPTQT